MEKVIKEWVKHHFLIKKLDTGLGTILLTLVAVFVALAVGKLGFMGGGGILVLSLGAFFVVGAMFNLYLGLYVLLVMSIAVSFLSKLVNLPYGLSLDLLLVVMALGVIMKQIKERDLSFAKSPLSLPILVWVFYNLIQVINPVAASRLAWAYTVRSMALLILLYFIACYCLNTYQRTIKIFKFMLGLAFASALYGLKQEYFGFADFELVWLYSDPDRFQLIFQWSRMRIFSFFSDPTNYGIYMSYMAVICYVLMLGPFKKWQRGLLFIAGTFMILSMAYAGSRTPVVLLPFGFVIFTILTLKRNIIIGAAIFGLLGVGFIFKSTGNAVLFRIQSAFLPDRSGDTMGVRFDNQQIIKPFIQSHPFGAGLGSVGEWGQRFSPHTFLASFPPDSGYVRVAVELGWVGYLLYCWMLYMIIRMSVGYYVRVRNEKIKVIYLSIICMMFMLLLASYVQEAIIQLPTSIQFYVCLAILTRLKDFDDELEGEEVSPSISYE
jgi:hypothetical protein